MATYVDKTHRVKKVGKFWEPQWKAGFLRWKPYELHVADTSIGSASIYSARPEPPRFNNEHDALMFLWKVRYSGIDKKYYKEYDEFLPGLVDE